MWLRRSYSTASDTRPEITRRATENTSRSRPAPTSPRQTSFSPARSPAWIWSIARPISHGTAAVPTIAMPARTTESVAPRRYGRRKPRSRRKGRTQPHDTTDRGARICKTRAAHDGSDRPPQPLRHGQGRVGRAPAGRALPVAGRRDGGAEDRAPRARPRRRDAQPGDAGDRRAGGRRDVGPRPLTGRRRSGQAAGEPSPRGPRASGSPPALARIASRIRGGESLRGFPRFEAGAAHHGQPRVLRVAGLAGQAALAEREHRAAGVPDHAPAGAAAAEAGVRRRGRAPGTARPSGRA